jgi:hypothetical protein
MNELGMRQRSTKPVGKATGHSHYRSAEGLVPKTGGSPMYALLGQRVGWQEAAPRSFVPDRTLGGPPVLGSAQKPCLR